MKACILLFFGCLLLSQINAQSKGRYNYGFALEFNPANGPTNQYVELPALDQLGGTMTLEAWVYPAGSAGPIFEFSNGYSTNSIRLRWSNGQATFEVVGGLPAKLHSVTSPGGSVPAGVWSMVTVVIANDRIKLYVNGANPTDLVPPKTWFPPTGCSRSVNYIGRDSQNRYFSGDIDEIVIWSTPLDQSDIKIRKVITGNETNVLYYWNFDQGIGGIADDLGRTNKNGALGGGDLTKYPYWVVPSSVSSQVCSSTGDPHITTFDGTYWHFQGSGEYWLLRSDDQAIQIQVRQVQWVGNPGACVNVGWAFRAYGDTVSIATDFRKWPGVIHVHINGVETPAKNIYLPNSGVIINYYTTSTTVEWEIDAPFLWTMKVTTYLAQYSNIWLRIYGDRKNTPLGGECGDWNGIASDDFRNPFTGRVYATNDYWNFGQSLAVPWSQSFFNDENQYEEVVPVLDIEFKDPVLEAQANQICKNRNLVAADFEWGCLFDIAVTGQISSAFPAAQSTYELCIEKACHDRSLSRTCVPPCPNFCSLQGTCNAGKCTCNPGYTARDCSVQKKYWCTKATYDLGAQQPKVIPFSPVQSTSTVDKYYAYNTRYGSSAFTGYEISNATMLLLHSYQKNIDSNITKTSFVMINDRYEDGSGGKLSASFALTDTSGNPVQLDLIVKDDPGDGYSWDSNKGKGSASWNWDDCCTDGLALGYLPQNTEWNLKINIDMSSVKGIDQYFLGSRASNGLLDIYKLDPAKLNNGLILSKGWCYDNCGENDNCSSCLSSPGCGWCEDVGVCRSGGPVGPAVGRCEVWRWTKDPTVSRIIGANPGYPVDPVQISVFLAPTNPIDAHIYVNMPDYDDMPVDIMILQDISYSDFNPYLKFLESIYRTVYLNTRAIYPLARFGLATFSDKPILPYGNPKANDNVYQLRLSMTENSQKFQAAITALTIADGQDAPQSQLEALVQISQRVTEAGYASTAKKLVAVVTKSTFHTPVGGQFTPNNGNGKVDSGEDYPSIEQARVLLLTANVVPIFVVPGEVAGVYRDLVNTWGFGYVSVMSSGIENLGQQILEGINFICTSPYLTPNSKGFIQSSSPQIYKGVGPGIRVNFDVTLLDNGAANATIVTPAYGSTTIVATRDDLPQASAATIPLDEGKAILITLSGFSYYKEPLVATILALPTRGTLYQYAGDLTNWGSQITSAGTAVQDPLMKLFYVAPTVGYGNPFDKFTYRLNDSCQACSKAADITLIVNHINHKPVANTTTPLTTLEDNAILIYLGGTDADGDPLVSIVDVPQDGVGDIYQWVPSGNNRGSILTTTDNRLTDTQFRAWYVPRPNLNGKSSFSYKLYDGFDNSSLFTVVVTVQPVNDPPVPVNGNVTGFENVHVAMQFTGADVDIGDKLTVSVKALPTKGALYQWGADNVTEGELITAPGTVILDPLGRLWYRPNQYAHGLPLEDVQFTISDTGIPPPSISTDGFVKVWIYHVNNPPQAFSGSSSADEDTEQLLTLTGFDPDTAVEGDQLFAFLCNLPAHGSLKQFDGTPITAANVNANGTWAVTDSQHRIRYQPAKDGNCGTCNVAYDWLSFQMADRDLTASDRLLSKCANVTLIVIPVNDPPVASAITPVAGVEDNDTIILLQCTDPDNEPISFHVAPLPTRGTLYQAEIFGTTWIRDGGNALVPLNGTVTASYWDGNLLHTGYVVFRGAPNANGWPYDAFTYHCEDAVSSSNYFPIDVDIQPVNDPPVANSIENITINEDSYADFVINGTDIESPVVFPQIVRCPDSSSQIGFLYQLDANNNLGNKIFVTNNQPTAVTSPNYKVRFVPAPNLNDRTSGSPFVTILYGVNDGNLSSIPMGVSISVSPVNDPPTATAYSPQGADEDTDIYLALSADDIDNAQSELSVYIDSLPTKGFLYQVSTYGGNTYRGLQIVSVGTKVADSNFRVIYRAPQDACSVTALAPFDKLVYHAQDLQPLSSAPKLVEVFVSPVNDPPVALGQAQVIGLEDSYVVLQLTATDVDNSFSQLKFTVLQASPGTLYQYDPTKNPPLGAVIPAGGLVTGVTAMVVFVPLPLTYSTLTLDNLNVYAPITWQVSDPLGLTDRATTNVVILHVNHPPLAITDSFSVLEDSDPNPEQLAGTDVDKIDTILVIQLLVLPSMGTLYLPDGVTPLTAGQLFDGNCQYQPFALHHGTDSLVYRVWDGHQYSTTNKTVTITIVHVNHRPVAGLTNHITGVENTNVGAFQLTGTDPDGDTPLRASITAGPTKGTLYQADPQTAALREDQPITQFPARLNHANNLAWYRQTVLDTYGPNYDSFQYSVNDGQGTTVSESFPATAIIDLLAANQPPTAFATTPAQGYENQALYVKLLGTTGDEGRDNDQTISFFITTFPTLGALYQTDTNGTVGTDGALHESSVRYLPPLNAYSFNDSNGHPEPYARFGFKTVDSLGASSAEFFVDLVILHVDQLPVAHGPSTVTTLEDTPVTFNLNSTDVEGDLSFFIVTEVPSSAFGNFTYQGTVLSVNSTFPSPSDIVFTPAPNKNGDPYCVFRYTVTDLPYRTALEQQYTTVVSVIAVNDAPTLTLVSPPLSTIRPIQRVWPEIQWNTTFDSDGFHGDLLVNVAVTDVDVDQNDMTFTIRATKGITITQMYIPFPNGTGLIEKRGNPITFTGTLDQLNVGLANILLERFDSGLGDELLIITVDDNGHTGQGGHMVANMTYYLHEVFRDLTTSGNQAAITGAAVAGGVGAIAAALGAYKLLKKKNLIDSADPWESEDAFQSTIDNPLYNHDQNANVLYEPPPSGTA